MKKTTEIVFPPLGEELYEFYPSMSAQNHEHEIHEYVRRILSAIVPSPALEANQQEKNPRLEYIPDTVRGVGDEFTRGGTTYRVVENPSSDGEVDLCLRLPQPEGGQSNEDA